MYLKIKLHFLPKTLLRSLTISSGLLLHKKIIEICWENEADWEQWKVLNVESGGVCSIHYASKRLAGF
jgi:hypothetical protein